jgi:hypothetical protein
MYGRHHLWTDGVQWYSDTWKSLEHYRYIRLLTVIERVVQSLKDRVERFNNAARRVQPITCLEMGKTKQLARKTKNNTKHRGDRTAIESAKT